MLGQKTWTQGSQQSDSVPRGMQLGFGEWTVSQCQITWVIGPVLMVLLFMMFFSSHWALSLSQPLWSQNWHWHLFCPPSVSTGSHSSVLLKILGCVLIESVYSFLKIEIESLNISHTWFCEAESPYGMQSWPVWCSYSYKVGTPLWVLKETAWHYCSVDLGSLESFHWEKYYTGISEQRQAHSMSVR